MGGDADLDFHESTRYYGLIEDITDAEVGNGYSRSYLLVDCVDARRFDRNGVDCLGDESALALVRALSTPRRWEDDFGLAKGDWIAFTVDDKGHAPRVWEMPAAAGYAAGPERSLRNIRRLGRGVLDEFASADQKLAFKLTSASQWARDSQKAVALQSVAEELLGTTGTEEIEIWALDVGQASASVIRRSGRAVGFFDIGAPIWFNKGSLSANFDKPFVTKGFVLLSHWDFDHFDLGRRYMPYRNLAWFAPIQSVGPNTAKFQSELGNKLTFIDGPASHGGFKLSRGTSTAPSDRNGTGYHLRYEGGGGAVLLTGDADYSQIPQEMLNGLGGVCIPHHGGRGSPPPRPAGDTGLAIASYGIPNRYRHPDQGTIKAHCKVGWSVSPTAEVMPTPRGNRRLYPLPST